MHQCPPMEPQGVSTIYVADWIVPSNREERLLALEQSIATTAGIISVRVLRSERKKLRVADTQCIQQVYLLEVPLCHHAFLHNAIVAAKHDTLSPPQLTHGQWIRELVFPAPVK